MHPAYSVILFTTASGAGYGLLMWLALTALTHGPASNRAFAASSVALALALITGGLLSSTFHLGHPERAWRAFSEWRSSWLSREGISSGLTYVPAMIFATLWLGFLPFPGLLSLAATTTLIMCIITLYCTAKIYSSLTTIRQWRHPLVDVGYLLLALATGSVLLVALASMFGLNAPVLGRISAFSLIAAATCKWFYWRAIDVLSSAYTIEQATGLGHLGKVRQWEAPHTGENFVMKEMGYRIARKHAAKLRRYVLAALFMAAATALASAITARSLSVALGLVSILCASLAVLIERWLFFAEAQHVSTLYYGTPAA
jgi:sulfite dehydrogenase (quinone) subunit SoeC